MTAMVQCRITAGCFTRRQVRTELERMKFLGADISWHESKSVLESEFTIKAPEDMVTAIKAAMDDWNKPA